MPQQWKEAFMVFQKNEDRAKCGNYCMQYVDGVAHLQDTARDHRSPLQ